MNNIYVWVVVVLVILTALSPRKREWRCPAPGCDFRAQEHENKAKDEHVKIHMAHIPVLREK